MKTCKLIPLLALGALALTSCRHKDLIMEANDRHEVYVAFDWRNAPEASPASMLAYFYSPTAGEPLLYTFSDPTGGKISIPYGSYSGIGINGDNTDWAAMRGTESPDLFEVYTRDAEALQASGFTSRSVPRAAGAESERMAKTPGMIWSDRQDNITVDDAVGTSGVQVITFYPEEAVCHYTVDILDIDHSEYLRGAEVDATLSGMAEGYLQGRRSATDVAVTMPFTLKNIDDGRALHAEFLTFGECASKKVNHNLTVYVILTDGTKWYQSFDVTDQVTSAADPRHVHIIVRGLDLPKPIQGGSGFNPDVTDWNNINIDLKM